MNSIVDPTTKEDMFEEELSNQKPVSHQEESHESGSRSSPVKPAEMADNIAGQVTEKLSTTNAAKQNLQKHSNPEQSPPMHDSHLVKSDIRLQTCVQSPNPSQIVSMAAPSNMNMNQGQYQSHCQAHGPLPVNSQMPNVPSRMPVFNNNPAMTISMPPTTVNFNQGHLYGQGSPLLNSSMQTPVSYMTGPQSMLQPQLQGIPPGYNYTTTPAFIQGMPCPQHMGPPLYFQSPPPSQPGLQMPNMNPDSAVPGSRSTQVRAVEVKFSIPDITSVNNVLACLAQRVDSLEQQNGTLKERVNHLEIRLHKAELNRLHVLHGRPEANTDDKQTPVSYVLGPSSSPQSMVQPQLQGVPPGYNLATAPAFIQRMPHPQHMGPRPAASDHFQALTPLQPGVPMHNMNPDSAVPGSRSTQVQSVETRPTVANKVLALRKDHAEAVPKRAAPICEAMPSEHLEKTSSACNIAINKIAINGSEQQQQQVGETVLVEEGVEDDEEADDENEADEAKEAEETEDEESGKIREPILKYKYTEDQWSPLNPGGKKHYDREFMLQFQFEGPATLKPVGLPDIPEIVINKMLSGTDSHRSTIFTTNYIWKVPGKPENTKPKKSQSSGPIDDRIKKKTASIIDGYLCTGDMMTPLLGVKEINAANHSDFVSHSIQHVLERSEVAREQIGHLLHELVKQEVITLDSFTEGLVKALGKVEHMESLKYFQDMDLETPKVWQYYGELISPLFQDDSVPLSILKKACRPLMANNNAGALLAEVLNDAINTENLEFTKSDGSISDNVHATHCASLDSTEKQDERDEEHTTKQTLRQLEEVIVDQQEYNHAVIDWIERNIDEPTTKTPKFIRALMTAVCKSAIRGEAGKEKVEQMKIASRNDLLQMYLDRQPENELQALYAIQALVTKLEHPLGMLRVTFDTLYDDGIISEGAFIQWERSEEETEGKDASLRQVVEFFKWLREAEDDS